MISQSTFYLLLNIKMSRLQQQTRASLCLTRFSEKEQFEDAVNCLGAEEAKYFQKLEVEKRRTSYLLGRFCAKKAVKAYTGIEDEHLINIARGVFGQPIVQAPFYENIQVSLTHCDNIGAAIVFSEAHPLAIDIERVAAQFEAIESVITDNEKVLIAQLHINHNAALYLLWTAKEALSKVLKTGLTTPPHLFEVEKIELMMGNCYISEYTNFSQYKALSFQAGDYMVSIVCPKRTDIDPHSLHQLIANMQTMLLS